MRSQIQTSRVSCRLICCHHRWRWCITNSSEKIKVYDSQSRLFGSHSQPSCSYTTLGGAIRSFAICTWRTNDRSQIFMFNIIPLNSNTHVIFIKKLFDASQIEFLLHALQVWLRGLLDLVIIVELCSCCASCSKGHWIGISVTHPYSLG